ncbi:MAG: ATP-binding protein [Gemmatimonadaceae bacterium]
MPPLTTKPRARPLPHDVAVVDRQLCDACGLCMPLCPPLAITMRREGLVVSAAACTGCRKCIAPCPVGALSMITRATPVAARGESDAAHLLDERGPAA